MRRTYALLSFGQWCHILCAFESFLSEGGVSVGGFHVDKKIKTRVLDGQHAVG